MIDGELVATAGRPDDLYRLGPAMASKPGIRGSEVSFVAFDLLWLDDELRCHQAYDDRRHRVHPRCDLSAAKQSRPKGEVCDSSLT